MTKTIPKKKKCKRQNGCLRRSYKQLSKEEKQKAKEKKERHTHLNAEFQRIARRDKKAFFSDQCKGIERNGRAGRTSNLLKKVRDTKGICYAKMSANKGQKWYGPNRSSKYQKWQEYTELYKKGLSDPDNYSVVIIHLEPDILECEIKQALGSTIYEKSQWK